MRRQASTYGAAILIAGGLAQGIDAAPPEIAAANGALGLGRSTVVPVVVDGVPGRPLSAIAIVDGLPTLMVLEPTSVRSEHYQLLVQDGSGRLRAAAPGPERTYRGSLVGLEGSAVAASLLEDGLHARVRLPDGEEYWIEPLAGRVPGAAASDYALYTGRDVLTPGACGLQAQQAPQRADGADGPAASTTEGGTAGGTGCVAQIACDADHEYFQTWGSVSEVEARIHSVINAVNVQYERDVDITHAITTIIV
ncbi:MAG: hypothetical protein ACYTGC_15705, partial [Planctomycetota bacterium]